ncbi:MAG TPA: hypothetical protein VF297_03390 [Pyrinomonadaceae bacterium]
MSATLEEIKEGMNHLAPQELREVRELADTLLSEPPKPRMTEEEFARYLAAKGVVSLPEPVSRAAAEAEFDDYEPITVEGQPLSEMIIEDRR